MSKVYLASFKGTHKGALGLFNKGVRFVNKGPYSHNEIAISEDPFTKPSFCVSSTGVGKGVHGKTLQLTAEDWDVIEIDWVTPEEVQVWLTNHLGCKYDWFGAFRFLVPLLSPHHPSAWFCTEVCGSILRIAEPWRFGPNDLPIVALAYRRLMGK
jgi:hypothetical protein